jgi:hypothetical protein
MNKLFRAVVPVALTLSVSVLCTAAHAHAQQSSTDASTAPVAQTQQVPSDPVARQTHGLTRKQVVDQLIQAENDGSLARLNATIYEGG